MKVLKFIKIIVFNNNINSLELVWVCCILYLFFIEYYYEYGFLNFNFYLYLGMCIYIFNKDEYLNIDLKYYLS